MKTRNGSKNKDRWPRSWFGRRRGQHDPMLVLHLGDFNSGSSWDRIFNPIPQRENVWAY